MADPGTILNIGDLAKPATALIEKVSGAVGVLFEPVQVVRLAQAEAKAAIIRAEAKVAIHDVHRRALNRWILEEGQKQANMEAVAAKALPFLEADSDASEMQDDWVVSFFEKCRSVSDEEMQDLWAKLLASEANNPGTYSKRTVNLLNSLDKSDAIMFRDFCSFAWTLRGPQPLILSLGENDKLIHKLDFEKLTHLDAVGLISFHSEGNLQLANVKDRIVVSYFGRPFQIDMSGPGRNEMPLGHAIFTQAGQQLFRVVNPKPREAFVEICLRQLAQKGVSVGCPLDDEARRAWQVDW